MSKQVLIDNDVIKELIDRAISEKPEKAIVIWAIDSGKFNSEYDGNEVLRTFLRMNKSDTDAQNNYPSSSVNKVQRLLEGLRGTIFNISKSGLKVSATKKWVANPNTVTIKVQESRAQNLRVTIYGNPDEFTSMKGSLNVERDMAGYSRFLLNDEIELPNAIKVIEHSYNLKRERRGL